jgi:hypothetical protein
LYKTQTISSIRDIIYNPDLEVSAQLAKALTTGTVTVTDYKWLSLPASLFVATIPSSFYYLLSVNIDQI